MFACRSPQSKLNGFGFDVRQDIRWSQLCLPGWSCEGHKATPPHTTDTIQSIPSPDRPTWIHSIHANSSSEKLYFCLLSGDPVKALAGNLITTRPGVCFTLIISFYR